MTIADLEVCETQTVFRKVLFTADDQMTRFHTHTMLELQQLLTHTVLYNHAPALPDAMSLKRNAS